MKIQNTKHKRFDQVYPYTYWIKCKTTGSRYHGVRFANVRLNRSPNEDLGKSYFTSGPFKDAFSKNPSDFEIYIQWTFDHKEYALEHEYRVNKRLIKSDGWINRGAGKNIIVSDEGRKVISETAREYWSNGENIKKVGEQSKERWKSKSYRDKVLASRKKSLLDPSVRKRFSRPGEANNNSKEYTFIYDNGTKIIVKGGIVAWCKDNHLSYYIMTNNLNTGKNIVKLDSYNNILKTFNMKVYIDIDQKSKE